MSHAPYRRRRRRCGRVSRAFRQRISCRYAPAHLLAPARSVKTATRFGSVAWGAKGGSGGAGLVAGGMSDGTVRVWDGGALLSRGGGGGGDDAGVLAIIERHGASVRAMQFNPHGSSQHLFASGSADGDVSVVNLEAPGAPTVASPLTAGQRLDGEVTAVGWNSSVPYILATAVQTGAVIVWDLKESKPWCTLRDPHRASVSDIAWNPEDGLYLVTASDDDLRPVLRVRRRRGGSRSAAPWHARAHAVTVCATYLSACLPACLLPLAPSRAALGPALLDELAAVRVCGPFEGHP